MEQTLTQQPRKVQAVVDALADWDTVEVITSQDGKFYSVEAEHNAGGNGLGRTTLQAFVSYYGSPRGRFGGGWYNETLGTRRQRLATWQAFQTWAHIGAI